MFKKRKKHNTNLGSSLTKMGFCTGLVGKDNYDIVSSYDLDKIIALVSWMNDLPEIKKYLTPSVLQLRGVEFDPSFLSVRALTCHKLAIAHLFADKYGDAIHELHDFIYDYGHEIERPVSELEFFMIYQWISIFNLTLSCNTAKTNLGLVNYE